MRDRVPRKVTRHERSVTTAAAAVMTVPLKTALTPEQDAILQRVQRRLQRYFQDFEELEGFTVLGTNLHRLFQKVMVEVRSVLFDVHDMANALRVLEQQHACQERNLKRQRVLSDALVREAQALLVAMQELKDRTEHDAAHARNQHALDLLELRDKMELDSTQRQQQAIDSLRQRFERQLAQVEGESETKLAQIKQQLEEQKACELEYARTRLRLQLKGQLECDFQHKLAAYEDRLARREEQLTRANKDVAALRAKLQRYGHR